MNQLIPLLRWSYCEITVDKEVSCRKEEEEPIGLCFGFQRGDRPTPQNGPTFIKMVTESDYLLWNRIIYETLPEDLNLRPIRT